MNLYISKSDSSGKNIILDDMILTKDMPTTAGSKMLDGYMSLFDGEVVEKLSKNGYTISGKANCGEMNIDLLGETSYIGACADEGGTLKCAMAEIIKSKEAVAGVGLEVSGALMRGAALSGTTFIKPTYGVVSRFGTIPAVCSGECVSVMAENAAQCLEVFSEIAGHDDKDGTSLPEEKCQKAITADKEIKKIAIAASLLESASDEVKALVEAFKSKADAEFEVIEADELLYAKSAWNTLMSAELCNNVSKYDGVKYGYRTKDYKTIDELYTNSRTESFGFLLKSTILYGSERLSTENYMPYYDKALRVRRVLCEYMNELFKEYDAVLLPVCSKTSYSKEDAENNKYIAYDESAYISVSLITGLPSVCAEGVQLIGSAFSDASLLKFIEKIEGEGR